LISITAKRFCLDNFNYLKHRHIVETGLAQSKLPSSYWVDAFNTAVYLINRLPTSVLQKQSPYVKLLKKNPDYSILRTFGCSCYPLLQPYNRHKLMFRSKKCIFLKYSSNYQGYRCLDPATKRIYLSRHVVFDETTFPAQDWISPLQHPSASDLLTSGTLPSLNNLVDGLHHSPSFHISPVRNSDVQPADHVPSNSDTVATPAATANTPSHALLAAQTDDNSPSASVDLLSSSHDLSPPLQPTHTPTNSSPPIALTENLQNTSLSYTDPHSSAP
jgi:hypothetical protein